ncbi:MAG TPA: nucleoid-structuring protein H-NS [Mycobacterium sp.]|nr:nucleoid-structuring protein H-NS [Mycobacterium sp.]
MPDPQDQPDNQPDATPAQPDSAAQPAPPAKAPAKKTPAKKPAKKAPAKKAAKKAPAKKAANGPAKKAPAKVAPPADVNGARPPVDGAKEAAARAKSTVQSAATAGGDLIGAPAPSSGRSPVLVLAGAAIGLLTVSLWLRRLRRRAA